MKKYFQAPWSLKETITIISTVILLLITAVLLSRLTGVSQVISNSENNLLAIIITFTVQWGILLLPLLIITKKKRGKLCSNLGFKKTSILKTAYLVVKGYLNYILIVALILLGILYLDLRIPGFQAQKELLPLFGTSQSSLVVAGIIAILIAPIIEEIFFRGFLLRSLSDKWGVFTGSIISAGIFASFHVQWENIIPLFILGLIINKIVIDSKSIVPAIAFHMFNNAVAFTISVLLLNGTIPIENIAN